MKYRKTIIVIVVIILSMTFLHVLTRLPDNNQREVSSMISDGDKSSLAKGLKQQLEQHPGQSGVILLGNGLDAFVGRAVFSTICFTRILSVVY